MQRKGFTLIELLVVIAVIAVLSAVLFPVFSKAREQARKTHCVNNMKQIYLAFRLYGEDFDGWWPSYYMPSAGGAWPFFLTKTGYASGPIRKPKPYNNYAVSEIFFCPSDTVARKGPNHNGRNDAFTSYGLNSSYEDAKYGYCGWKWDYVAYVDGNLFDTHDTKVMLADAGRNIPDPAVEGRTLSDEGGGLLRKGNLWAGHNGQANVLFTDGHVETSAPDGTDVKKSSKKWIWSYTYNGGW